MKQFTLNDYHGNHIHIYQYEPTDEIKGVIHIIHGASEHFARYGIFSELSCECRLFSGRLRYYWSWFIY